MTIKQYTIVESGEYLETRFVPNEQMVFWQRHTEVNERCLYDMSTAKVYTDFYTRITGSIANIQEVEVITSTKLVRGVGDNLEYAIEVTAPHTRYYMQPIIKKKSMLEKGTFEWASTTRVETVWTLEVASYLLSVFKQMDILECTVELIPFHTVETTEYHLI